MDLLEEIREESKVRSEEYKRRVAQYHNTKVKPQSFKEGELVLRKIETTGKAEALEKLRSNWKGLFMVSKVIKQGSYRL